MHLGRNIWSGGRHSNVMRKGPGHVAGGAFVGSVCFSGAGLFAVGY